MVPSWMKISGALCVFGFLREIRPSEPFHAEIQLGEWYNVTRDQVNRAVYPVGTYSYLTLLIVVFLITDFLRYKAMVIANALTGIIVWSIYLWTSTLTGLQVAELFYGFYQATEVAYYSYIYAKVEKKYYPRVTSHTRSAMYIGKLVAGFTAQLVIFFELMNYYQLMYISVSSQVLAFFWAIGLPSVEKSLYFNQQTPAGVPDPGSIADNENVRDTPAVPSVVTFSQAKESQKVQPLQLLWSHFHSAYTNAIVAQWSFWYAINLAGYLQITTYMQVLWKSFENEPKIAWNGFVDVGCTALSALFSLLAGYFYADRVKTRASLMSLSVLSVLEGGCILLSSWTTNIYLSYLGYVLFCGLFGFTITVASSELAKSLDEDSFALIFGINTLVALILQTVLTIIVVSEDGNLNLETFEQFTVYAFYYFIIGTAFLVGIVIQYVCVHTLIRKLIITR